MSSRLARCRRQEDANGAALVEFALVLPVFALMLFGMVQLGIVFAGWAQLRNSVQTAARLASVGALESMPECGQFAPPGCRVAVETGLPPGLEPEPTPTVSTVSSAGCTSPLATCSDYSWLDGYYIFHAGSWQQVVNDQQGGNGQLTSQVLDNQAFAEGVHAGWTCAATDHQGNCTEVATDVVGTAEGALASMPAALACRGGPPGSKSCSSGMTVVVCASLRAAAFTDFLPPMHVSTQSAFYMETGTATTFSTGGLSCG
jgi:Flp pilus assembly pilin Flp